MDNKNELEYLYRLRDTIDKTIKAVEANDTEQGKIALGELTLLQYQWNNYKEGEGNKNRI